MIAVVSDSHIPKRAEEIPEEFYEIMGQAELIIHCGDFESEEFYNQLKQRYDSFIGVKGNNDFFDVPVSETFKRRGVEFGVYHGTGIYPRGHPPTLVETANKLDAEVLFHGHTHVQKAHKKDGKVLLNPGSCTGLGRAGTGIPKMMTVEIKDAELEVELIELADGELITEQESFEV